jgi:signal transduction histidine kinase
LGLPICDRIIKAHGGAIEVESERGAGTTFRIHMPIRKKTAEQGEIEQSILSA